ncbi:hypothetical protein [Marivita hallyeonensis]|uniref:Uncharacterized protein n=1 Tax=Marivita hallyeonensis TaxID=996342 RepID=A0A1M5TIG2_9RHOB|nr:hypothetical protein [Marivita hallyeonensis]SHH50542.1 hypothetical protein SAMN05443551_2246 [Marivita hallyeonensis]
MSRKFIAAVLAVSTTLAAFSAAPARAASEDDIARLLGAAATLFIIGKAIESSRDKDKKKKKAHKEYKAPKATHKPHVQYHNQNHKPLPQVVPRDRAYNQNRVAALPARCVRQITGGHVRRVVMDRCLQRHYTSARPLPRACRMNVATQRGERRAYALPCLRHRGYTLARN